MNGTILRLERIQGNFMEARFLRAWVRDADTAVQDLFSFKFYEFDPGGRDGYITQIGYLLYEEIIPLDQYQKVVTRWILNNSLSQKTWFGYDQILSELFCHGMAEWISENFCMLCAQVEQVCKHDNFHNIGRKLYTNLAYKVASAKGCGRNRRFLQQYWYSDPTPDRMFVSAFSYEGKYGVEAEKAIAYFIKVSRRRIAIEYKNNCENKKKHKKRFRRTYNKIYHESVEEIVKKVRSLLRQRYDLYRISYTKYEKLPQAERDAIDKHNRQVEEKIERIIKSQNVECPL
jgi:hypothetical protein